MSNTNSTLRSRALALTANMLADNVAVVKVAGNTATELKPYFLNEYTTQEITDGLTTYAEAIVANHDVVDVAVSELQDAIGNDRWQVGLILANSLVTPYSSITDHTVELLLNGNVVGVTQFTLQQSHHWNPDETLGDAADILVFEYSKTVEFDSFRLTGTSYGLGLRSGTFAYGVTPPYYYWDGGLDLGAVGDAMGA